MFFREQFFRVFFGQARMYCILGLRTVVYICVYVCGCVRVGVAKQKRFINTA